MIKAAFILFFVILAASAPADSRVVYRTKMAETDSEVLYKDRLADGSLRDSKVKKPAPPEYPERVELTGTNSLASMWELIYVAHYAGGRVQTNYDHVVKSQRQRAETAIDALQPPTPRPRPASTNRKDAVALALARHIASAPAPEAAVTNRMKPRAATVLSERIDGGQIVRHLSDGTETRTTPRRAYTARVAAQPSAPAGSGTPSQAAGAAAAAAIAAGAAGYIAGKKGQKNG